MVRHYKALVEILKIFDSTDFRKSALPILIEELECCRPKKVLIIKLEAMLSLIYMIDDEPKF